MHYQIERHRAMFDPFLHGDAAAQLGLMMNLTDGWEFPWRSGGVALMRRELYPTPHAWEFCGLAIGADSQIKNYPGYGHVAEQAYQYAAVCVLGNGMISHSVEPIRLDFDDGGDLIDPRLPMWPLQVVATPIAGGKFDITFEYDRYGQGGSPADFQVFEGADAGSVDYDTPLTDSVTGLTYVLYSETLRALRFTTEAFGDGTPHVFGVRGRNSGGVAEHNTFTTRTKTAKDGVPASAAAALYGWVEHRGRIGTGA